MCQFKSGIIFKSRIELCDGESENHSKLLNSLKIVDNDINAMKMFVRAELIPPQGKWWTNPSEWIFNVAQDILPNWFTLDREKYEEEFRNEVIEWCRIHVLFNQEIDTLSEGYYLIKDCRINKICGDTSAELSNSVVGELLEKANIRLMTNNSKIHKMCNGTVINMVKNNSVVCTMTDDSIISLLSESTVYKMCGHSLVEVMDSNSKIDLMQERSRVQIMLGNSKVVCMYNYSVIGEMRSASMVCDLSNEAKILKMLGSSVVSIMDDDAEVHTMQERSKVQAMYSNTKIRFMKGHSIVGKMAENSIVQGMVEYSLAFSYGEDGKIKIMTSDMADERNYFTLIKNSDIQIN